MQAGRRLTPPPALDAIRKHVAAELERLPEELRPLDPASPYQYDVRMAPALRNLTKVVDEEPGQGAMGARAQEDAGPP